MSLPGGGQWGYQYQIGAGSGHTALPKDEPDSICKSLLRLVDDQGASDVQLLAGLPGTQEKTGCLLEDK